MPRLSIWAIRAALIHLGIGFTVGGLMLFNKGVALSPTLWRLWPIHIELVLIGWTVQLAMGVAFWILPRIQRMEHYGNPALARVAFVLLNSGVLLVAAGSWPERLPRLVLIGRGLELSGVIVFVIYIWRRVKPFGG